MPQSIFNSSTMIQADQYNNKTPITERRLAYHHPALGSTGDILPYAALGHHLKSAGYEVSFVSSENYRTLVSGLKLSFFGVPDDAKNVIEASGAKILSLFRSFADLSRGLTAILDPGHPELGHTNLILN